MPSGTMSIGATEVLREIEDKKPISELEGHTLAQNSADLNKSSFSSIDSKAHPDQNVQVNKVTVLSTDPNPMNDWPEATEMEYVMTQIQNDPFDKVLLLKNIDNAILTSYRTLSK